MKNKRVDLVYDLTTFPTKFKGVVFNADFEFDMACIIYYPVEIYDFGNAGYLESMVEDYCIELSLNHKPSGKLSKSEILEFVWRGWTMKGMAHRKKNASQYIFTVKWYLDMYPRFTITKKEIK